MPGDLQLIDGFEGLRSAFAESNPGVSPPEFSSKDGPSAHTRAEILSAWFTAVLGLDSSSAQHLRWLRSLVREAETGMAGPNPEKGLQSLLAKVPRARELSRKVSAWCDVQGGETISLVPTPASPSAESSAWARALPGLTGLRVWRFMELLGRPVVVPDPAVRRFFWRLGLVERERGSSRRQLQAAAAAAEALRTKIGFPHGEFRRLLVWHSGSDSRHAGGGLCRVRPDCAPCSFKSVCAFYRYSGASTSHRFPDHVANERDDDSDALVIEAVLRDMDRRGVESLSETELVAVLAHGGKGASGLRFAARLLRRFGGLRGIHHASIAELCSVEGVGAARARQIKAGLELGRRLAEHPLNAGDPITASGDVYRAFHGRFSHIPQEHFVALMLDAKNRYMDFCIVSKGTLTTSHAHPREVFKAAIRQSASGIILMHNHPSGDPSPSSEDIASTRMLVDAGRIIGIRVLDHIILGQQGYYSFKDEGRL